MTTNLVFHISLKSQNKKVGPIPVSTSPEVTCPTTCPLKGNGCYASSGPLSLHWSQVNARARGVNWDEFCNIINNLPEGQIWRHNQAGDLNGYNTIIDYLALEQLVKANKNKQGFTYTHYPVEDSRIHKHNIECIRYANTNGFVINLSGDSLSHADRLVKMQIGPVTTLLPSTFNQKSFKTPDGNKGIVCPVAIDNPKITSCMVCQLCAKPDRKYIIGFPAHGSGKKKVDILLNNIEVEYASPPS